MKFQFLLLWWKITRWGKTSYNNNNNNNDDEKKPIDPHCWDNKQQ